MDNAQLEARQIDEMHQYSCDIFSCGYEALDTYLRRYAKKNHKKGIGKTFVLADGELIVGFYTVSMSSIDFQNVPLSFRSGIPKYPIPVAIIGRLAVDLNYQGKKLGGILLINALKRIFEASKSVAAYAVIVDAKDKKSTGFYERYGFVSYKENPLSLYLPMTTLVTMLEDKAVACNRS